MAAVSANMDSTCHYPSRSGVTLRAHPEKCFGRVRNIARTKRGRCPEAAGTFMVILVLTEPPSFRRQNAGRLRSSAWLRP
jgi:hypothetical protein